MAGKKLTPISDGFYWLYREKEEPTLVYVWDCGSRMTMVASSGSDCDQELKDIEGKWVGPIAIPEHPWSKLSLKEGETIICDTCASLIEGNGLDIRDMYEEFVYVDLINRMVICRECFDRDNKPKPKGIWDLW